MVAWTPRRSAATSTSSSPRRGCATVAARRGLRRQIGLLSGAPRTDGTDGRDDGTGGVREPRRPLPPYGGPGREEPVPRG